MYFLGKQVKGYNWWAGDDKYSISHSSAPEDGLENEDEDENKGYAKLWCDTNPEELRHCTVITREKYSS